MVKKTMLAVLILLSYSTTVVSQCAVVGSTLSTNVSTMLVTKTLVMNYVCSNTQKNAINCFPSFSSSTNLLVASANSATANPICVWSCTCGTVTIDGTNGLPVELLEFSVAAETTETANGASEK